MMLHVRHATTYLYTSTVSICHNELHLQPRHDPRQTCLVHELLVQPPPAVTSTTTDFFGNHVTFIAVQEPHRRLVVTANSTVELHPIPLPAAERTPSWETVRELLRHERTPSSIEAYQYTFDSPLISSSPALDDYARPSFPPDCPLLTAVLDLTRRIYTDFLYDPNATSIYTPLHDVLQQRRGVCQDFAHVHIGCLRTLGLAARYVSGYLVTQPPSGKPRLVGADASHAWVSVYCPGTGWVEADPTNNLVPSEQHIIVAYGRDYSDVSPIKGVFLGGGRHTMQVAVDVLPESAPE